MARKSKSGKGKEDVHEFQRHMGGKGKGKGRGKRRGRSGGRY